MLSCAGEPLKRSVLQVTFVSTGMTKRIITSGILILCSVQPLVRAQRIATYHPFGSQHDYESKLHVIRVLVNRYGRVRSNRIFVAKEDSGDGRMALYGYWPEGHSILLVDHYNPVYDNGKEITDYEWLEYKTRIDLRTDVVATEKDIAGSSYLVDRLWAKRIINACLKSGRQIMIRRNT